MGLGFLAQMKKEQNVSQKEQGGGCVFSDNVGLKRFVWGEGPSCGFTMFC